MSKSESVFVIGAGAAGMTAAITAARYGRSVTIAEQNEKEGRKILVSGNGKCNIGNAFVTPKRFHCSQEGFVSEVLRGYDSDATVSFLRSLGIETTQEKDGRLFPMGRHAASVVDLFRHECDRLGIDILYNCEIVSISKKNGLFELMSTKGSHDACQIILAAGSPAAPQLGGSMSGIDIARSMGHDIVPLSPALSAVRCLESWPARAAGVKIAARTTLRANGAIVAEREGDLLFTDYGVSGLSILDLSREISLRLRDKEQCVLEIDLMPSYSKKRLTNLMNRRIVPERGAPLKLWLDGIVHRKLSPIILKKSAVGVEYENQLNTKAVNRLAYTIKNLTLTVEEVRGFRYAETATGGVDVSGVDPVTMESKKIENLFFAGEILDVDGDRGGYNFHWAWSTGMRAGEAASKKST